jgi:hypothetical protein
MRGSKLGLQWANFESISEVLYRKEILVAGVAAMHRNCHLDRAFSVLPRRRLGRMKRSRPTNKGFSTFC